MKIKFGRDGHEIGEYPEEAVPALMQSDVLRPSDIFWHNGMTEWTEVASKWPGSGAPPIPRGSTAPIADHSATTLAKLSDAGWDVVSQSELGVQLKRPKRFSRGALILGLVCLVLWGLGILILLCALIDYALAKDEVIFISKADLARGINLPKPKKESSPTGKVILAIVILVVIIAIIAAINQGPYKH